MFLDSYVVNFRQTQNTKNRNTPQKSGRTSFLQDKLWLHVQKLLFFIGSVLLFLPCCSQNTINIEFFDEFDKLLLGQNFKSITWPPQGQ